MSEIGENKNQQEERIDEIGLMPLAKDFLIELSDLRPGDILLFRSLDKKMHQRKISRVTVSPYTHAAIYIGNGEIAESKLPKVRIRKLSDADKTGQIIGVLRSQMVFSARRAAAIKEFVNALINQNAKYDLSGALTFKGRNEQFVKGFIDHLKKNYGKVTPEEELAKRSYFCSALVVACYIISAVIGDSAQAAYPPDVFSPGDLYRDPTFGWFLGYLASDAKSIPADDPLMSSPLWKDHQDMRWWS